MKPVWNIAIWGNGGNVFVYIVEYIRFTFQYGGLVAREV